MNPNPHIGSTLDGFLKEEGLCEDATTHGVKRLRAWQAKLGSCEQVPPSADATTTSDATTLAP